VGALTAPTTHLPPQNQTTHQQQKTKKNTGQQQMSHMPPLADVLSQILR